MSKHRIRCLKFSREVTRSLKSCGSVFLQTFPLKEEALISGLVAFLWVFFFFLTPRYPQLHFASKCLHLAKSMR